MRISLIVATVNRTSELAELFKSLSEQEFKDFEVLIIDQNQAGFLDDIINEYNSKFAIKHFLVDFKHLAKARNYGLDRSTGDIVCFPDDDCKFYKDTLQTVHDFLCSTNNNFLLGRIVNPDGSPVLKNWKTKAFYVSKFKLYRNLSAITYFGYNNDTRFDERLGVGGSFGSCEDVDYVYRILKSIPRKIYYCPQVKVWHPDEKIEGLDLHKIEKYGRGFGAFCRKNFDWPLFVLFFGIIIYHFVFGFFSLLKLDFSNYKKRMKYVTSRAEGFCQFKGGIR
ncbi:MAG: glycosyltransferase [Breznakibacter sp.]|nr:glycosyltransferase [Breznakibacter sp.]